jgi:hypothetical protein
MLGGSITFRQRKIHSNNLYEVELLQLMFPGKFTRPNVALANGFELVTNRGNSIIDFLGFISRPEDGTHFPDSFINAFGMLDDAGRGQVIHMLINILGNRVHRLIPGNREYMGHANVINRVIKLLKYLSVSSYMYQAEVDIYNQKISRHKALFRAAHPKVKKRGGLTLKQTYKKNTTKKIRF